MFARVRPAPQLLCGLLLITVSIAVLNTLVPLWMTHNIAPTWQVGAVGSAYFTGNLFGATIAGYVINRVGHLRSYTIAASLFAIASLGLLMTDDFYAWAGWRFAAGVGCALIWVVVESALLCAGRGSDRSRLLALYMIIYYLGTVIGQLLITVLPSAAHSVIPWLALLIIISVLPVLASRLVITLDTAESPPVAQYSVWSMLCRRQARLGVSGCLLSGAVLGSLYSLMPLYLANHGMQDSAIGLGMALMVCAGIVAQWPLARLADYTGKLLVLRLQMLLIIFSAASVLNHHPILPALFILGCASFTLYPIAISWACESARQHELVAMNQALLLSYTVGNLVGPSTTSLLMQFYSDRQLFVVLASMAVIYLLMLCTVRNRDVNPAPI